MDELERIKEEARKGLREQIEGNNFLDLDIADVYINTVIEQTFTAGEKSGAGKYAEGYKQGKFDAQIESSTWGIPVGCCRECAFYLDYKDDWQCNGGIENDKCECHPEAARSISGEEV